MRMPLFVRAARAANVERVNASVFARRCERGSLDAWDVACVLAFQAKASRGFLPFLEALADRSPEGRVRTALLENLSEERDALPCPHAEWAVRTHGAILDSLAISDDDRLDAANTVAPFAEAYLARLEELLSSKLTPTEAAAAFALAVEDAVPSLYTSLIKGLSSVAGVRPGDLAFFEAHVACDVDHALRILVACLESSRDATSLGAPSMRWRSTLDCASNILLTRVESLDSILATPRSFSGALARMTPRQEATR